ncbi:MAG: TolC family protein [Rikenellaceae bacterium]
MRKFAVLFLLFSPLMLCGENSLTLEQYTLRVVDYSHALKQSEQSYESALSDKKLKKTDFLPSLSLSGDASYQIEHPNSVPGIKDFSYLSYLTLSQTVYQGGTLRANNKISDVKLKIAKLAMQSSLIDVVYASELVYWALSAAYRQCEIAKDYVEKIETLYKLVSLKFEDGLIARTDLLMTETQLSGAKFSEAEAYQYYKDAVIALNILVGQSDAQDYELSTDLDESTDLSEILNLDYSVESHPSFRAAELAVDEAVANISLTRAGYNPSLSVGARAVGGTPAPVVELSPKLWGEVYLSLSVPIFDWGARRKSVAKSVATRNIASLELAQTKDDLISSYQTAENDLVQTLSQLALSKSNLDIAAQSLELQTFSYKEGGEAIIYILQAQLAWLEAYNNYVLAAYNHKISVAKYKKASSK